MPDPNVIAMRAIEGQALTDVERSSLTPALLAQLSIGGYLSLTDSERQLLPATLLANLALCSDLVLTRAERDRLPVPAGAAGDWWENTDHGGRAGPLFRCCPHNY